MVMQGEKNEKIKPCTQIKNDYKSGLIHSTSTESFNKIQ